MLRSGLLPEEKFHKKDVDRLTLLAKNKESKKCLEKTF